MNANFFAIVAVLSALSLLASAWCAWRIWKFDALRKTFFAGKNGENLEEVIRVLQKTLQVGQKQQSDLEEALKNLERQSALCVQKLGLVRFNPFDDGGGNFSFSLALLDLHDTGVIITSMHGRQQNRIYTKTIQNGRCDIQLTEEEQQAVSLAHEPRTENHQN